MSLTLTDMLQMRNLSIDPDFYNKRMGVSGRGIGMYRMLERVNNAFFGVVQANTNPALDKVQTVVAPELDSLSSAAVPPLYSTIFSASARVSQVTSFTAPR